MDSKSLLVLALGVSISLPGLASTGWGQGKAANVCELLTRAEAQGILNESVSDGQSGKGSMPAVSTCKYSYSKKGATYGVTLKVATSDALKQEGFYASARDVFTRQKKARMSSEQTAKRLKVLPGLGDDAFWNGHDLWIVKGEYFINIVSSSFLGGAYKSSEEMEKARADQDEALARKLAEKVLPRLK
jgi:hypothetical protein